jgi:hypothetical protein
MYQARSRAAGFDNSFTGEQDFATVKIENSKRTILDLAESLLQYKGFI